MKAKSRVTFKMCTNADGWHTVDCMVIGKAKKPNVFALADASEKVEKIYSAQSNSCVNGVLFEDFLKRVWYPAVRRRRSDVVILIWYNCSAHGYAL